MLNIKFNDGTKPLRNLIIGLRDKDELQNFKNCITEEAFRKAEKIISGFDFKKSEYDIIKLPDDNTDFIGLLSIESEIDSTKIADSIITISNNLKKFDDINVIFDLSEELTLDILEIVKLKSWTFDKYKSKKDANNKNINFISNNKNLENAFNIRNNVINSVSFAKELISEPASIVTPKSFEEYAKELENLGVEVSVLDFNYLKQHKMGGIVAVGEGSDIEPRIIVLKYMNNKSSDEATVLVGKGITFDSGGLNLKPSQAIYDMKTDMSGAAAVIATIKAVASNKLNKNVVGILGLAENLPSGHSYKPGDVITMMNGMTVEVGDTDAEGRLVLADCLTYAQKNFKVKEIIDLATLTGACIIALGYRFCGLFANDDQLKSELLKSSKTTKEALWELPMCDFFDKAIDSDIADIKNIARSGTGAGSSTAAHFLKRFIEKNIKWSHLDIAGVAFTKESTPVSAKGATGFGVRLLYNFIENN